MTLLPTQTSLFFLNLSKVLVPGRNQKIQLFTELIMGNQTKGAYTESISIGPELIQNNQARFEITTPATIAHQAIGRPKLRNP